MLFYLIEADLLISDNTTYPNDMLLIQTQSDFQTAMNCRKVICGSFKKERDKISRRFNPEIQTVILNQNLE